MDASTSGSWNATGCATAPDMAALVLHVEEDLAWSILDRGGCEVSAAMVLEKGGT